MELHDAHTRAIVKSSPYKVEVIVPRNKSFNCIFENIKEFKNVDSVLELFSIYGHPKVKNKTFTELLGHTPSNFRRILTANMICSFKEHPTGKAEDDKIISKWIKRLCHPKVPNRYSVRRVLDAKDKIIQAEKDGIQNIIPIIIFHNRSPQQLKKKYGKGKWKEICKQSMTRNFHFSYEYIFRTHLGVECVDTKVPSFILKKFSTSVDRAVGKWLYENKIINSSSELSCVPHWGNIIQDMTPMAEQMGIKIPDWKKSKPSNVRKKHDELVKMINEKKYSPIPFEKISSIKTREGSMGEYTFHLLDNARAIGEEGSGMGHCVASYSGACSQGNYLVYSIRKDGNRISTLGIHVLDREFTLQQHYGKYNSFVSDEVAEIGIKIVDMLNKEKQ